MGIRQVTLTEFVPKFQKKTATDFTPPFINVSMASELNQLMSHKKECPCFWGPLISNLELHKDHKISAGFAHVSFLQLRASPQLRVTPLYGKMAGKCLKIVLSSKI